jgi:hypothetical protein
VQARADRGFDPRLVPDGDARADGTRPLDAAGIAGGQLQIGKFATLVGNWVLRRLWQNPFVTAPLPPSASRPSPTMRARLAGVSRAPRPGRQAEVAPVVWGPSYASGVSFFGHRTSSSTASR